MSLDSLRERLTENGIILDEERTLPGGWRVYIFTCLLPGFPFGHRRVWYPLVVTQGQTEIPEEEIEALLRHCWHLELNFFGDE
jgi:hypothetical protein